MVPGKTQLLEFIAHGRQVVQVDLLADCRDGFSPHHSAKYKSGLRWNISHGQADIAASSEFPQAGKT
ncbi:MAG: hypothetical protein HS104_38915 [Polyangiaceae bacterium]|nr:hypothetical protein [Polyangiaceae bacterium]